MPWSLITCVFTDAFTVVSKQRAISNKCKAHNFYNRLLRGSPSPWDPTLVLGLIAGNWTGMWLTWISLWAGINSKSVEFWKKAQQCVVGMRAGRERSALAKELKSVRELRVYMNSSFYYDKSHVVTTIGFILNQMATI